MASAPSVEPNMRDYEETRRTFRWDVPEYYNFAVDTIGMWAADPARPGMVHVDHEGRERTITFAEFAQRSDRLASALRQHGIGPGDRVLVVLPRVPDDALEYLMYLLREVSFAGNLLDNGYLQSVGLCGELLEERLVALPGLRFRRQGDLIDFGWRYAHLADWTDANFGDVQEGRY